MERYTPQQRLQIFEIYNQNQCSVIKTYRALRSFYGPNNRPSERAIHRVIEHVRTNLTFQDLRPTTRMRPVRSAENIAAVEASVEGDRNLSIRRRAQEIGLCPSTVWKILRKDLGLKAYKIQLVQELKPCDHRSRRNFAEWAQNQLEDDPLFYRRIVFSDEAHFWLNGYVNKQNCRIWSDENPHQVLETPLHPEKCTVWCGLYAGGIIGPYFFKNDAGQRVTVNGDRYRAMIVDYLFPNMRDIDAEEMWFQQDGATSHTSSQTIDLLKTQFGEKVISRNGPVNWPPRSCDLTPLDYFLWGYVKSLVYATKPATIDALETEIERVIAEIRPQMLEKVIENWTDRMRFVTRSRGGHMPEIIFKH